MIVILTYGKVSSISLRSMLLRAFPGDVFYSHGLQPLVTTCVDRFVEAEPERGAPMKADGFVDNPEIQRRLEHVRRGGETVTFLVGVREPVGRSLSSALQVLETFFPECQAETDEATAERLATILRDVWMRDGDPSDPIRSMTELAIRAPFVWLRSEIEEPFGFDIRSGGFDTRLGYRVFTNGNLRLLLYRFENAPQAVEAGLGALFPGRVFHLPKDNVTDEKGQAALYAALKRRFSLPMATLDTIYGHPYVQPFLSPAEIAAAKARWSDGHALA